MSSTDLDIGANDPDANPIFAAQLMPYRSLTPAGFALMMAIVGVICASNAYFYFHLGAWPVAAFFFLDIALLYAAFKISYRAGKAREEITVWHSALEVRKIAPNGRRREHTYNPFWAKFLVERDHDAAITSMCITGEGYRSTIGAFLNPEDRESFASAFAEALAQAKK